MTDYELIKQIAETNGVSVSELKRLIAEGKIHIEPKNST